MASGPLIPTFAPDLQHGDANVGIGPLACAVPIAPDLWPGRENPLQCDTLGEGGAGCGDDRLCRRQGEGRRSIAPIGRAEEREQRLILADREHWPFIAAHPIGQKLPAKVITSAKYGFWLAAAGWPPAMARRPSQQSRSFLIDDLPWCGRIARGVNCGRRRRSAVCSSGRAIGNAQRACASSCCSTRHRRQTTRYEYWRDRLRWRRIRPCPRSCCPD